MVFWCMAVCHFIMQYHFEKDFRLNYFLYNVLLSFLFLIFIKFNFRDV